VGTHSDDNDERHKTQSSTEGYAPAIAGGSRRAIEVVLIKAFVYRVDESGGGAAGALEEIPQCLPGCHRVRLDL
jgi:hypothetical protein